MPNVALAALVDVDDSHSERFIGALQRRDKKPVPMFRDIRKVLEDKNIDAVSIATPNHWHTLQTIWAVQAGKDVYVEKPCSHNVFESKQIIAAARKYNRRVQMGSQSRSSPALQEAVQKMKEGEYGDIYMARGLCFKSRNTIGKTPVEPVPPGVDYDMWTGPAPLRPFTKNRFHYNWHWFWDTGNGDLGNQGIHEVDIARWGLGVVHPTKVSAIGGKFMFDDDQETPNTMNCSFEFNVGGKIKDDGVRAAPLVQQPRSRHRRRPPGQHDRQHVLRLEGVSCYRQLQQVLQLHGPRREARIGEERARPPLRKLHLRRPQLQTRRPECRDRGRRHVLRADAPGQHLLPPRPHAPLG